MKAHAAADLFPLMGEEELAELAEDIRAHGLREPVWLWNDPDHGAVLLDGRNRARACELAGVRLDTRTYAGDDPIGFSISLNVKRRHLTTGQKAAVAVAAEPLYAAEAAKRRAQAPGQPQGVKQSLGADLHQEKRAPRAADHAAKTTGTSGRAVGQYKRVEKQAPDLADKIKAGTLALDRAERIIRDREAERRRIEQARREAAAAPTPTTVDIRHGDFREVLADLDGVEAVITDPPYGREWLPLLEDLAAWADKVLTPEGVLAVLMGQSHLPEVYRLLDGHRPYRWTACWLTPAAGYVSHTRRVQTNWKPLLIYGEGPRFGDVIRSEGSDAGAKDRHHWGQDYLGFHTLIERLTERGQTVADPFMGSGTTLLAALALGRHAVGADVDPAAVATARERVA